MKGRSGVVSKSRYLRSEEKKKEEKAFNLTYAFFF